MIDLNKQLPFLFACRLLKDMRRLHFYFEEIGIMTSDMWCKFDEAEKSMHAIITALKLQSA